MSRVKYLCYQIFTYVFGIYTSAKFNSAKFNLLCAVTLKILFSEDTKMDKGFNFSVMNNEQITFKLRNFNA